MSDDSGTYQGRNEARLLEDFDQRLCMSSSLLVPPARLVDGLLKSISQIVADEGAAWQHVALDMFMMAQLSARERTAREWRELIESCGLKIVGFYNKGKGNEGLIEVVVCDPR